MTVTMPPDVTVAGRAAIVIAHLDQLAARNLADLTNRLELAMVESDDDLAALERLVDLDAEVAVEQDLEGRHWPT